MLTRFLYSLVPIHLHQLVRSRSPTMLSIKCHMYCKVVIIVTTIIMSTAYARASSDFHHGRGPHPCPAFMRHPKSSNTMQSSVIDHILSVHHTDIQIDLHSTASTGQLLSRLVDADVHFAFLEMCDTFVVVICVVCPM